MPPSLRSMRVLLSAVLLTSCATGSGSEVTSGTVMPPTVPPTDVTSPAMLVAGARPAPQPVPIPGAFQAAIGRGTRTDRGVPGPRHWTQRVDYSIEAELDPETAILQGRESITYQNNSPDDLDRLIFRLYQNLFSPGAQRTRTVPITGGITLERVAVEGDEITEARGRPQLGTYLIDGTLMALYLPERIQPGGTMEISIDWRFEVPPAGAPRQGHIDGGLFNVAQWYPQVAVYDDVDGWHFWPYLGNGEFYLEYGDFEVSITVPEGWLVGASGTLMNPEEVLPEPIRRRFDQGPGHRRDRTRRD